MPNKFLVVPSPLPSLTCWAPNTQLMRDMVAREGRDQQLYEAGSRVVAGGIVLNTAGQVLMVSSQARKNKWVIPKGGAEIDESLEESALREVWEEGGAEVERTIELVGTYMDLRPPKHWDVAANGPAPNRSKFYIYKMILVKLHDEWPEAHKRKRVWMDPREAHAALLAHDRIPLAEALEEYMKRE